MYGYSSPEGSARSREWLDQQREMAMYNQQVAPQAPQEVYIPNYGAMDQQQANRQGLELGLGIAAAGAYLGYRSNQKQNEIQVRAMAAQVPAGCEWWLNPLGDVQYRQLNGTVSTIPRASVIKPTPAWQRWLCLAILIGIVVLFFI